MHTFFLEPEAWKSPWRLAGAEAAHAIKTLRLGPDDEVRLLDGRGRQGRFRITGVSKRELSLEPVEITEHPRPARQAWLALGWNKAARRGWLLEKAVELRAGGLLFWQARRSQGRVPEVPKDGWTASLVAGAKQSVNPWLPELGVLPGGADELARAGKDFDHRLLLWENRDCARLDPARLARPGRTLFVLGPEGGLEDDEAALLIQAGFEAVGLGPGVLRWETAALLALGLSWWATPPDETKSDTP